LDIDVEIRRHGLGPGSWQVYSAMGTSPDGDIYTGVCDYSFATKLREETGGAHLMRYSPGEDRSYDLGDMQDVTAGPTASRGTTSPRSAPTGSPMAIPAATWCAITPPVA
jgi:hypothetical protein